MRPRLCRLCERPAADGDYEAAELDLQKLDEWCLNYLGTTLAEDVTENDVFCNACVSDARFLHNNEMRKANLGAEVTNLCWWPNEVAGKKLPVMIDISEDVEFPMVKTGQISAQSQQIFNSTNNKSCKKKCEYCNKMYVKSKMSMHINKEHSDIAIRCTYRKCATYYKTLEERDAHIKETHLKPKAIDPYPYVECIYCNRRDIRKFNLSQHVKINHSDTAIKCNFGKRCLTYFKTNAELEKHYETKHKSIEEKKKFKCSVCIYKAAQAQDVEHHESKFHSSSNKKYNCSKCTETFSSKVSLSDHILRIHKFRKCPTCELQIPFSHFDNHLQRSRCGKCNANFKCSGDRQKHQQNCKPVIQKCEICSKVFKFKHLLGYHMNEEHAGVKMIKGARFRNRGFECKICTNYYFKNRKSLDMHIKIKHSGNHQKLQCAHCSKKFAFKYSLSKHLQNTHNLAVKKFRCEPCNKHFFHNSYLKSHIMKVHSKERITCEFCDKILKTLQLKNHLRKFHGKY